MSRKPLQNRSNPPPNPSRLSQSSSSLDHCRHSTHYGPIGPAAPVPAVPATGDGWHQGNCLGGSDINSGPPRRSTIDRVIGTTGDQFCSLNTIVFLMFHIGSTSVIYRLYTLYIVLCIAALFSLRPKVKGSSATYWQLDCCKRALCPN